MAKRKRQVPKRTRKWHNRPVVDFENLTDSEVRKIEAFARAMVVLRTHKRKSVSQMVAELDRRVKVKAKRRRWPSRPR